MPRKQRPPSERRQISLRLDPDTIERLEDRALEETMRLGSHITLSSLLTRGAEMVLSTPLPGRPARVIKCNLVPAVNGSTVCLTCKQRGPERTVVCGDTGEEVERGS